MQMVISSKTLSKIKNNAFPIAFTLVCLLTFLHGNMNIAIPIDVFTLVIFVALIFFKKRDFVALAVVMPLFYQGVRTVVIFLIAIIVYYIKYKADGKLSKYQFIILALLVLEIAHIVFEPFSVSEYFGYVVTYWYLGIMIGEATKLDNKGIMFVASAYVLCFLFLMLYFLSLFVNTFGSVFSALTSSIRFGNMVGLYKYYKWDYFINLNENTIALMAICAVSVCAISYFYSRKKIMWFIGFVISSALGVATRSKTFVICMIFMFIYLSIILLKRRKTLSLASLVRGFIILGVGIISMAMVSSYLSLAIERLTQSGFSDRDVLFSEYNQYMSNNPQYAIMGIGLQSLKEKTGVFNSPHNGIQEVFVCWGIIGLAIIVLLIVMTIKDIKTKINRKIPLENLLIFFEYFLFIQTIQFIRLSSIYFLLVLVFTFMSYNPDESTPKNVEDGI